MRWPTKPPQRPKDKRTVVRFAWFPVALDDGTTRWLERYLSYQEWMSTGYTDGWVVVVRMAIDPELGGVE